MSEKRYQKPDKQAPIVATHTHNTIDTRNNSALEPLHAKPIGINTYNYLEYVYTSILILCILITGRNLAPTATNTQTEVHTMNTDYILTYEQAKTLSRLLPPIIGARFWFDFVVMGRGVAI